MVAVPQGSAPAGLVVPQQTVSWPWAMAVYFFSTAFLILSSFSVILNPPDMVSLLFRAADELEPLTCAILRVVADDRQPLLSKSACQPYPINERKPLCQSSDSSVRRDGPSDGAKGVAQKHT